MINLLGSLSLSLRIFIIVIGGVAIALALSHLHHTKERSHLIDGSLTDNASQHLVDIARALSGMQPSARMSALVSLSSEVWSFDYNQDSLISDELFIPEASPVHEVYDSPQVVEKLTSGLDQHAAVIGAWTQTFHDCPSAPRCPIIVSARIRFNDGQKVMLHYNAVPKDRKQHGLFHLIRYGDILVLSFMTVVAWAIVLLSLRPLKRMTKALERFGNDISQPGLDVSGPPEVRLAAETFNAMQGNIRELMAERTHILSSVTHDICTPLTRMRLRIESCSDEDLRSRLRGDIKAIQHLIDEGLELSKSLYSVEQKKSIDLHSLLQSICDDLIDAGYDVAFDESSSNGLVVFGHPLALRRIFDNLLDNAVKYGTSAHVSLSKRENMAWVKIRDIGPGIPEYRLQDVLKPFVRLETSRSRETGGTGLGLSIVANLIKTQGGVIEMTNHPEGGLVVLIGLHLEG
ncbi:MAG: ATP-binding protein [Methylococcus sp.]|jgi:signal transduction histidine kinase